MRERLTELNTELVREFDVEIVPRTGLNTGEVIAGDPSAGQSLVTGDAVNTAARLEQAAAPGEVLIGEATYLLVRDAVVVEPVEPVLARGKTEPVPAHRLLTVILGADPHAHRLDAPMVGRERELDVILSAFDDVEAERACSLVTVLGEAGSGSPGWCSRPSPDSGDRPLVFAVVACRQWRASRTGRSPRPSAGGGHLGRPVAGRGPAADRDPVAG